jgi:hypothetical protein
MTLQKEDKMDIVYVLLNLARRSNNYLSELEKRAINNAAAIIEQADTFAHTVKIMEEDLERINET